MHHGHQRMDSVLRSQVVMLRAEVFRLQGGLSELVSAGITVHHCKRHRDALAQLHA